MIGLPGKKKAPYETIDDIETRALALKNRIEGKVVYFLHHTSKDYGQSNEFKALIIDDNKLIDITTFFKGISDMLTVSYNDSIALDHRRLTEALRNLSLIVYGKQNGFSYDWIYFK